MSTRARTHASKTLEIGMVLVALLLLGLAGTASALLGFLQMTLASLVGLAVGQWDDGTQMPMVTATAAMGLGTFGFYVLMVLRRGTAAATPPPPPPGR